MKGWARDCRRMARRLIVHAALAVTAVATGVAVLMRSANSDGTPGQGAAILAAALGAIVFTTAAHATLDAWLFGLMASHGDERSGGAAVDRMLARLRFASPRDDVRSAAARIAGAELVLRRLRLALAAFAAATILAAALSFSARA